MIRIYEAHAFQWLNVRSRFLLYKLYYVNTVPPNTMGLGERNENPKMEAGIT